MVMQKKVDILTIFGTPVCLLTAILTLPYPNSSSAESIDTTPAIEAFLSSQESVVEHAELEFSEIADLSSNGQPELIILWSLQGATYWSNHLAVFKSQDNAYTLFDNIDITGTTHGLTIENGLIYVDRLVHGPNDPICCPSIHTSAAYRLTNSGILKDEHIRQE